MTPFLRTESMATQTRRPSHTSIARRTCTSTDRAGFHKTKLKIVKYRLPAPSVFSGCGGPTFLTGSIHCTLCVIHRHACQKERECHRTVGLSETRGLGFRIT